MTITKLPNCQTSKNKISRYFIFWCLASIVVGEIICRGLNFRGINFYGGNVKTYEQIWIYSILGQGPLPIAYVRCRVSSVLWRCPKCQNKVLHKSECRVQWVSHEFPKTWQGCLVLAEQIYSHKQHLSRVKLGVNYSTWLSINDTTVHKQRVLVMNIVLVETFFKRKII